MTSIVIKINFNYNQINLITTKNMMIVITKQPLPCYTTNGLMWHIGNPLKKRIIISLNLMPYIGNDSYTVENLKLKNKMCRQANDSYHPLNPLKERISISSNLMRYVRNDSYTVKNLKLKNKMCRQTNDSYHLLNPQKERIFISLNLMCYVRNDSCYTVKIRPIKKKHH